MKRLAISVLFYINWSSHFLRKTKSVITILSKVCLFSIFNNINLSSIISILILLALVTMVEVARVVAWHCTSKVIAHTVGRSRLLVETELEVHSAEVLVLCFSIILYTNTEL